MRIAPKVRRWLLTAAVPLAALIPAVAITTPAYATQGGVCEAFGSWCIGGGSSMGVGPGDAAINVSPPGRTFIFSPGPGGTGTLHALSNTSICLAPISDSNRIIEYKDCSATGVSFTWVNSGGGHFFVNVHTGLRLSGTGTKGDHLSLCPAGGCSGGNFTLQRWNGP
jgi:hypothetical protein